MVKLKRNLLSVALASAMTFTAAGAYAQSTEATAEETAKTGKDAVQLDRVTVTGIRRGIEDAIDTKQSEDTIVEAISAEDIGKLPDSSIADSIARLPGLTAQRFGGRPQEINIRGFAGDFATTLLNGREQVSLSNSRGVEFDQYPSELISSVVVHKTTDAELVGQGLSGTVNLKTVRPLSFDDRVIAANIRGDMNKVDDLKKYGNRYSFAYIDQFADRTVGLALGYAHLNNPGQGHQYGSWGYNETAAGSGIFALGGSDVFTFDNDNQRDGLAATLEFKPSDIFSTTLDVFYSKFDKEENKRGVQFGLATDAASVVATRVSPNGTVLEGTAPMTQGVLRNDFNAAYDKLFSVGWANELKLGENWNLTTDVSYSRGKRREKVLETYAANLDQTPVTYTYNPDGLFDLDFGLDFSDPDSFALMDPGGWGGSRAQAGYLKNFEVTDELNAFRVGLQRSFDHGFVSSLEFGANMTEREKGRGSQEFTLCITQACTVNTPAPIPLDLAQDVSLGFAGVDSFLSLDPNALVNNLYYQLQKDDKDISAKNWTVHERVGTAYAQININTDLGPIPVKGNLGIQAVNVEQSSTGLQSFSGASDPLGIEYSDGINYTNYLPSLNLSFQFPADQYLRVGAGRQLSRPSLDDMRASNDITYNSTRTSPNGVAGTFERSAGNPRLKPFLADSYDLSYEKYFGGNRGYVSAAYFFKDLKTYIYRADSVFDIRETGYPLPAIPPSVDPIGWSNSFVNGEGGTIKGLELSVSIPFDMLWGPLEGFGFLGSYSDTQSEIHPNGPGTSDVLPGLSKYVSNMTLYYDRYGFSARVSQRSRSQFVGEVTGFGGDRQLFSFDGEKVVDMQMGYTFQSGALENLSILLQVNNLTDEPFRRINTFDDRPAQFTEYGRTYLLGLNYKF